MAVSNLDIQSETKSVFSLKTWVSLKSLDEFDFKGVYASQSSQLLSCESKRFSSLTNQAAETLPLNFKLKCKGSRAEVTPISLRPMRFRNYEILRVVKCIFHVLN